MTSYLQYTGETKTYNIDVSDSLSSGDSAVSAIVSGSPSGLTISSATVASNIVTFTVSGGTVGVTYTLTITTTTNDSNVLVEYIYITIGLSAGLTNMVLTLRVLINDFAEPLTYSDVRLAQILCVAASLVQSEVTFPITYTVDVSALSISPDPVDPAFMNFTVLKAACFLDQSAMRTRASLAGLRAVLGPAMLDTGGHLDGFAEVLKNGACSTYSELKLQYSFGNVNAVAAILSPFVNNQFHPHTLLGGYSSRE